MPIVHLFIQQHPDRAVASYSQSVNFIGPKRAPNNCHQYNITVRTCFPFELFVHSNKIKRKNPSEYDTKRIVLHNNHKCVLRGSIRGHDDNRCEMLIDMMMMGDESLFKEYEGETY